MHEIKQFLGFVIQMFYFLCLFPFKINSNKFLTRSNKHKYSYALQINHNDLIYKCSLVFLLDFACIIKKHQVEWVDEGQLNDFSFSTPHVNGTKLLIISNKCSLKTNRGKGLKRLIHPWKLMLH